MQVQQHPETKLLLSRVQARLLSVPGVRDVHPDRQLTRALAWEGDTAASAQAEVGPAEELAVGGQRSRRLPTWEEDGDRIRKRPGRCVAIVTGRLPTWDSCFFPLRLDLRHMTDSSVFGQF